MNTNTRYGIEMAAGVLAYGLGLAGLNAWYVENAGNNFWLASLVCLPILYIATVIIRFVSNLDEMQQKIVIEAMAFSGLATGFTCFSYLFFRNLGAPEFRAEWAFYAMWLFYGIGCLWSSMRYR